MYECSGAFASAVTVDVHSHNHITYTHKKEIGRCATMKHRLNVTIGRGEGVLYYVYNVFCEIIQ